MLLLNPEFNDLNVAFSIMIVLMLHSVSLLHLLTSRTLDRVYLKLHEAKFNFNQSELFKVLAFKINPSEVAVYTVIDADELH